MTKIVLTIIAAGTLLSSTVMAQEFSHGTFAGGQPVIDSLSGAPPNHQMRWSSNPDVFNTDTSNPTYVQHDHGQP